MTIAVQLDDGTEVQLQPDTPDTKLFVIEGFTLRVEMCENGDGRGWGIKYTTYIKDCGMIPSVWLGDANLEEPQEIIDSPATRYFEEMTQEQATEEFKRLIGYVGKFCAAGVQANTADGSRE